MAAAAHAAAGVRLGAARRAAAPAVTHAAADARARAATGAVRRAALSRGSSGA